MLLAHSLRTPVGSLISRISDASLLAAFTLVAGTVSLFALANPERFEESRPSEPSVSDYRGVFAGLNTEEWIALGGAVLLLAWLLQPFEAAFQRSQLRRLTGVSPLRPGHVWHTAVREITKKIEEAPETFGRLSAAAKFVRDRYPNNDGELRISSIGNLLAVAEQNVETAFPGFDLARLGGPFLAMLDADGHDITKPARVAIGARLFVSLSLWVLVGVSIVSFWDAPTPWRIGTPLAIIVIATASRMGVARLVGDYQDALERALTLYRFDLLNQLHLSLPTMPAGEEEVFRRACLLVHREELESLPPFVPAGADPE